ncbi:telomere-protecting terminal protein Tpg [Streptomyces sp. NPDC127051]|uniref:telomere-protecting terminal protein Tpg n=1 Tax=Streptomyces sp. NPDC127051 TaxID=3347119 RepID=UPI00365C6E68
MGKLGDSLDQAVAKAFTRPAPKSAQVQMKYLVKQLKSTKAAADALGVSQRTVERYLTGKIKRPRKGLAARLTAEVRKRWQPQIRAKAKKVAATSGGLLIETRARFGYTAAAGTTDDGRMRHLTQAPPLCFSRSCKRAAGLRARHDCVPLSKA